jgi:hypothetical protein
MRSDNPACTIPIVENHINRTHKFLFMNRPPTGLATNSCISRPATAVILVLGLLVCAIAISNQSFWIDECDTAYWAALPTLADWWQCLRAKPDANLQVPLYLFFSWFWEKISGLNEWALRAGNVPWFLFGLVVMSRALPAAQRLRWIVLFLLLCNSFVWFYLNEARPYAMQIGASLVVFASLFRLVLNQDEPSRERLWVAGLCVGSLLLSAGGMLAMLWTGAYLGAALLSMTKSRLQGLARSYWPWWVSTGLLLFMLGLFYLWTLSLGARATTVGNTDARNFFFILYELFGFSGLGPGRNAIRAGQWTVFLPWLPGLAIYGGVLLVVLAAGCRSIAASTSRRILLCWILAFALILGFILAVGVAVRFRVLGRHCAPLLPLVLFVLGSGIAALLKRRDWVGRLVLAAFVGLSLISCLSLRFSERHAKDDYRGAAAMGREALARGETVWWGARKEGAILYHLPLTEQPVKPGMAVYVANQGKGFERDLPKPDLVLTSKADLFDSNGALADYLARAGFCPTASFPAFTTWRAAGK